MGPDHHDTCVGRNGLAEAYLAAGRTAEAIGLYEENLRLRTKNRGPDHPDTDFSRERLGAAYNAASLFAKSEPMLRQCLTFREKNAPDGWWTFDTRSTLGGSLLGQKKFAEAEPLIVSGYEGMKARETKIPPSGKPLLAEAAERVVNVYEAWGKKDKAAEWRARLAKPSNEAKSRP
jgi:hypothetical protein